MTARHTALLTFLAGFVFSLAPCRAQDGAKVSLQFLSFPRSIEPKAVELVVGEGKTITVELPSNELSPTYEVPRLASWTLGETAQGEDGKPAFKVFGKAGALASPRQLILVIRKGAENADGLAVLPIDNRMTEFGGGKFLFVNAATVDIAGEVGAVKFALKPAAHSIVRPRVPAGERSFQVVFYYRAEEKMRAFFSSKWPRSDEARGLIFFYHDPDTRRLRLHTLRNFP